MNQLIKDVLDDMSTGQINLSSNGARELIATTITAALKTKGCYTEYDDSEIEEQNARAPWVCSICGENTADVDYDYLGSGTNHLGCEMKTWNADKFLVDEKDDNDYYTGPDGSYKKDWYEDAGDGTMLKVKDDEIYHVVKNLGYDCRDKKQTVVGKISKSQLNNLYPRHEEEQ